MKQQTAVEWLAVQFDSIVELNPSQYSKINNAIDQAKVMEKEQIQDAYKFGLSDEYVIGSERYYNETFK